MSGKAAVEVIAGHLLLAAIGAAALVAERAFGAWQNSGNNHGRASKLAAICAGVLDNAADFMAERQRR